MGLFRQRSFHCAVVVAAFFVLRGGVARGSTSTDTNDDNFREDVIECEQAAAHLRDCCPNATSAPDCHYYDRKTTETCGCSESYVTSSSWDRPIAIDQSKEIQNSSCDELAQNGTCDRQWASNAGETQDESGCSGEGDY